jgi:hypothetical protein
MKNLIHYTPILVIALALSSCGAGEEQKKVSEDQKVCFYTYNHSSSVLEWTAFKFTEKTGVKGSFNEIIVEEPKGSDDPLMVLTGLNFKIPTASVETQNEERNGKIAGIFFKTLVTDTIRGVIKKIDPKKGSACIELEMNGKRKDVNGKCSLNDAVFSFSSAIDLNDWKGSAAIKALNTACKDLHTGADGKSVLWSTVDLSFSTELISDCN